MLLNLLFVHFSYLAPSWCIDLHALPNKLKIAGSTPGGDANPFGFASGGVSGIKTGQIKYGELPAVATRCD